MVTLKKGQALRAQEDISVTGSTFKVLPVNTVFYCVRGGANPKLVFASPTNSSFITLSVRGDAITSKLVPIAINEMPARMAEHLGINVDNTPLPRFKKGDIATIARAFDIGNDTFTEGTMARCERGGKAPHFTLRHPASGELMGIKVPELAVRDFAHAEPVIDAELAGITHKIKTFEAMSEETLALNGEIRLPEGERIAVSCHGHGDPVLLRNAGSHSHDAVNALVIRLDAAIASAGIDPSDITSKDELYVSFLTSTEGMETFGEYVLNFQKELDALCA